MLSKWVMSLAENFDFDESANIAFDRSNEIVAQQR